MSTRAISLAAAAAFALALATIASPLVLASDHEDNKAATIALAVTAGVSFIASGLVALWRRPDNRTGYLLAAVGYLWFFGALTESNNDWVFTIGLALNSLVFGAFIHLLLAFPGGRLTRRRDLWLVVSTYVLVFAGNVATLLLDEVPDPKSCPECRSTIAVGSNDDLESVLTVIVTALALAILVTVLVVVVSRYLRSQGALAACTRPGPRRRRARDAGARAPGGHRQLLARSRAAARVHLPRDVRDGSARVPRRHPAEQAGPVRRR